MFLVYFPCGLWRRNVDGNIDQEDEKLVLNNGLVGAENQLFPPLEISHTFARRINIVLEPLGDKIMSQI